MILPLNTDQLEKILQEENVTLIDVREREEFDQGYIKGAELHPLSAFDPAKIPSHESSKLIFYCKAGGRSQKACFDYLTGTGGAIDVYNYEGGFDDWKAKGKPIAQD